MNKITYRISLDTSKNGIQRILQGFNEGDKVARRIEIALTNGGVSVPLADTGVTALMYVTISGTASTNAVTIEEGKAIYEVDTNDTASAGIVDMNLKILDTVTGMVLYAPRFQIEVWENGIGSSTAATSETFTALESALAQAQLYSQSTIDSVYIDEDNIFTVEYKDESKYTSTVIADAITAFEEATEEVGDLAEALSEAQEYASSASASATSASTSASNASTSATSASASATSASESATSASSSATSASASKEAAATSASNASASATSASQSATSATASKEAAASSATSASQSATSASTSASSATASKNAAATSATSASTSASSALASKTAAESAATRAEEAATQATQGQKQADYEQTDDTQKDFIKNKPIIDILTSTSPTLTLSTSRGGIRLDKVVGEIHKSKNVYRNALMSDGIISKATITYPQEGTVKVVATTSASTAQIYKYISLSDLGLSVGDTITISANCESNNFSAEQRLFLNDCSDSAALAEHYIVYSASGRASTSFTIHSGATRLRFILRLGQTSANVAVNDYAIFSDIQIEKSSTATSYEPYGVLTSGMGCVDLGSLTWTYNSSNSSFYTTISTIKVNTDNIYCEKYKSELASVSVSSMTDKSIKAGGGTNDQRVFVKDLSFGSDVTSFTKAMKGTYLAYELAESASADKYAIVVKEHGEYGCVDLGSLTWLYDDGNKWFYSTYVGVKRSVSTIKPNLYCEDYATYSESDLKSQSKGITSRIESAGNDGFIVKDTSTTSTTTIKSKLNGVLCAYELADGATPTNYGQIVNGKVEYANDTTIIPISSPLTSYDSISEDGEYRAYGRVDLGSLTWTLQSGTPATRYYATFADIVNGKNGAIVCASYNTITQSEWVAFTDGIGTREIADNNHRILICDSTVDGDVDALKAKLNGILAYYEKATPTLTPLSTDQTIALHSLKAYDGKTYLDSADVYAKPTLSVGYSKVQSLALENENLSKVNARLIEDLQSADASSGIVHYEEITLLSSTITKTITKDYKYIAVGVKDANLSNITWEVIPKDTTIKSRRLKCYNQTVSEWEAVTVVIADNSFSFSLYSPTDYQTKYGNRITLMAIN